MTVQMSLSTGNAQFDDFLQGGIEAEILTTVYGPSGSGKTNFTICAAASCLKAGKKVLYIDTEASFSVTRAKQIMPEFEQYAQNIKFLKPTTFQEQKAAFQKLYDAIDADNTGEIGLIIIDSIAMLYRLELGMTTDIQGVNRELGVQLGKLTEITRKKKIPIIITNQVYADFENKNNVNMVGGDLLKYTSKCLIELKKAAGGVRIAKIVKHRSIPEGATIAFKVVNEGMDVIALEEAKPAQAHEII